MPKPAVNGGNVSSTAVVAPLAPSHNGGESRATDEHEMPPRFFWIALGYLLALIVLFVVYQVSPGFRKALPASLGTLPIGVPWFGAVGATLLSLSGTTAHRKDWNSSYEGWHYARPWVGGVIGAMGTLILLVIVEAATKSSPTLDHLTLYVVAFIVGYREQSFRDLIRRASDLVLSPGYGPTSSPSGSPAGAAKQKKASRA